VRGHHAFLLRVHLGHIHHLSGAIEALDAEVEKVIARSVVGEPRGVLGDASGALRIPGN
jgi:hypothetical protein